MMRSLIWSRKFLVRYVRRVRSVTFLVLVLAAIFSGSAWAQGVQVPFDRDSTLYTIDPDLRTQVGLFPEVSGFRGAELYRVDSTTHELVLRIREGGTDRRERRLLSVAEVESLREQIETIRSWESQLRDSVLGGRAKLIGATSAHGFIEGGLLTFAFRAEEDAVALTTLGGSVGFFGPLLATRKTRVMEAEANMTFYGGIQGYAHGVQLAHLVGGSDVGGRATAGIAALTGAVEGTVAYRVARHNSWQGLYSEMVSYHGLAGNLIGAGIGGTVVGDNGSSRVVAGMSLLGSVGGAYLGHRLGRAGRYSEGDLRVYGQSTIWATYLATALLIERETVSVREASAALTGSTVGGAWIGNQLVHNRDFTRSQSEILGLGGLSGILVGGAIGELAETDNDGLGDFAEIHMVDEALGAIAGFSVTYAVLGEDARRDSSAHASAVNVDLRVRPAITRGSGALGSSTGVRPRFSLTAVF